MSFESIEIEGTARERILKQKATNIHTDMKKVWSFAQKNLGQSQQNQKKYADRKRKTTANYKSKNKM